ncbi:MAG: hypothetical protein Q7U84_10075, partial [Polynucleobacter sp.]|nr:hypothetical protein [Polynucleobacter sp.]
MEFYIGGHRFRHTDQTTPAGRFLCVPDNLLSISYAPRNERQRSAARAAVCFDLFFTRWLKAMTLQTQTLNLIAVLLFALPA